MDFKWMKMTLSIRSFKITPDQLTQKKSQQYENNISDNFNFNHGDSDDFDIFQRLYNGEKFKYFR